MHVLDDAESKRAAAAIRLALNLTAVLAYDNGTDPLAAGEREALHAIADHLEAPVPA